MKFFIQCLLLVCLFVVADLHAAEISDIRYGKTEQRSRLVIESDTPLDIQKKWQSGKLTLQISSVDRRPANQIISADALAAILNIDYEQSTSILQIKLPVTQQSIIKLFHLNAGSGRRDRLVIDWRTHESRVSSSSIIADAPKRLINPVKKNSKPANSINQVNLPKDVDSLIREARNALTDKQYSLAVSLLNKVIKQGNAEQKSFALEFIGVARERKYQLAFAKQYYQRFLKEYPDSENAPRVQQRLSALIGIQDIQKKKRLKDGKRANQKRSTTRGSIATDYRQSELVDDLGESRQTLSLLSVDVDVRGDYQFDSSSIKFRLSGGHYEDLLDEGDDTNNRLRYANFTWFTDDDEYRVDVGRQRSRGKGIFGRYDGVLFGYGVNDTQKLNVVFGSPVSSSKVTSLDPERSFVGLSYDWKDVFEDIDISMFGLHQSIGDLTDRQAVGGEVKYRNQGTSFFGLIDYDIFYSELNAFLLSSSITTVEKTRYHFSYNLRKSPYISTRNALIGQAADSVEELQNLFITDEEILDLATDRTLESKTATLQISHPLNKTYDLSGNITWTTLSGAPASGGVAEIVEPGGQLYFNIYLRGSRLYSAADSNQLGIRVSQLSNSDVWSIYVSSQYRWDKAWSIGAKLRYDDRQNDNGGGQQNISPSFRFQYQNKEQYIYADFGAIFYTNQLDGLSDVNTDIYYVYLGYRYFFQ